MWSSFFFFLIFTYLWLRWSSLLRTDFLSLRCAVFSCCGAWALGTRVSVAEAQALELWCTGLVAWVWGLPRPRIESGSPLHCKVVSYPWTTSKAARHKEIGNEESLHQMWKKHWEIILYTPLCTDRSVQLYIEKLCYLPKIVSRRSWTQY